MALQMLYTALVMLATGGRAILLENVGRWAYLYRVGLVAIALLYYGFFWRRSGQTLGMRAWRLVLRSVTGSKLSAAQILARGATAPLAWLPAGLGVLWLYIDPEHRALQDRWTATRVDLEAKSS
jgi:uncharacterized RDD family membrane protein YckC